MRLFQQERAIYEVTELIESVMAELGVTRAELARRLGKSKGWVTQLLDGEANKTIRTVADAFAVLGREFRSFQTTIRISNVAPPPQTTSNMAPAGQATQTFAAEGRGVILKIHGQAAPQSLPPVRRIDVAV
jgi:transcriptional regulator with XRE-family HTH domain